MRHTKNFLSEEVTKNDSTKDKVVQSVAIDQVKQHMEE